MFESPPAAPRSAGGPFDRVEDQDPFDKYFNPHPPLDTPWPADVPPPGSGQGGTAWPGLADQETASWPAVPGAAEGPHTGGSSYGGPPTGGGYTGPPSGGSGYSGPPSGGSGYNGPPTGGSSFGGPSTEGSAGGPSTGPLGRSSRFGTPPDLDHTGPLPIVHSSALDGGAEEFLPIFAAVESDWFRRSDAAPQPPGDDVIGAPEVFVPEEPPGPAPQPQLIGQVYAEDRGRAAESRPWSSPGDAGWQAAQAASDPSLAQHVRPHHAGRRRRCHRVVTRRPAARPVRGPR
jgi:hypothetical protein